MQNYRRGTMETVTWTNGTGSDVSAGDPVWLDGRIGIACVDIDNGDDGAVAVTGVLRLAKDTSTAFTQGQDVDWDDSESECGSLGAGESDDLLHIGKADVAADASDAYLDVDINVPETAEKVA